MLRRLGSVAVDVQRKLAAIPRPIGYELVVSGRVEEQRKAFPVVYSLLAPRSR